MPLKRLILIRHGKAEQRSASGQDFDRALTERGHIESQEAGRRLAEAGFAPDLGLVSSAVRASETWDEAASAFPNAKVERLKSLYNASAGQVLEAAKAAGAESVAVVGHNPGMHALAFELAARGMCEPTIMRRLNEGFSTASAAVFRFDDGKPTCEGLFVPKDER